MDDEEDDRTGVVPPAGLQEISPELKDSLIDAFAETLDLTIEDVQMRLLDGDKFWQIAQDILPSLEDVEDACTRVQFDVLEQALNEGLVMRAQTSAIKRMLYCELFPAVEMGDGVCRDMRMPVLETY